MLIGCVLVDVEHDDEEIASIDVPALPRPGDRISVIAVGSQEESNWTVVGRPAFWRVMARANGGHRLGSVFVPCIRLS